MPDPDCISNSPLDVWPDGDDSDSSHTQKPEVRHSDKLGEMLRDIQKEALKCRRRTIRMLLATEYLSELLE